MYLTVGRSEHVKFALTNKGAEVKTPNYHSGPAPPEAHRFITRCLCWTLDWNLVYRIGYTIYNIQYRRTLETLESTFNILIPVIYHNVSQEGWKQQNNPALTNHTLLRPNDKHFESLGKYQISIKVWKSASPCGPTRIKQIPDICIVALVPVK